MISSTLARVWIECTSCSWPRTRCPTDQNNGNFRFHRSWCSWSWQVEFLSFGRPRFLCDLWQAGLDFWAHDIQSQSNSNQLWNPECPTYWGSETLAASGSTSNFDQVCPQTPSSSARIIACTSAALALTCFSRPRWPSLGHLDLSIRLGRRVLTGQHKRGSRLCAALAVETLLAGHAASCCRRGGPFSWRYPWSGYSAEYNSWSSTFSSWA